MSYPNIFDKNDVQNYIDRINQLTPDVQRLWGRMTVDQMLAHLNVVYDMTYTDKYPAPWGFGKFMAKLFAKNIVVWEKPYKKNNPTAKEFKISWWRDFEAEKKILIDYLRKTQKLWAKKFEDKENMTFGILSSHQRNNLFSKHLDHHLRQFGV